MKLEGLVNLVVAETPPGQDGAPTDIMRCRIDEGQTLEAVSMLRRGWNQIGWDKGRPVDRQDKGGTQMMGAEPLIEGELTKEDSVMLQVLKIREKVCRQDRDCTPRLQVEIWRCS